MTLFYKNKEDVVESEDDSTTVNVGEVCQHCGNESGYTLVGKVGEAEAEEDTMDLSADVPVEDSAEATDLELPMEDTVEEDSDDLALDETELDAFIANVLPMFIVADGNVKHDVSRGIIDYKEKNKTFIPRFEVVL